jgi:hypothetical protein
MAERILAAGDGLSEEPTVPWLRCYGGAFQRGERSEKIQLWSLSQKLQEL